MKLKFLFLCMSIFSFQSFADYSVFGVSVRIDGSDDSMIIYGNQIYLYREEMPEPEILTIQGDVDGYIEKASAHYLYSNEFTYIELKMTYKINHRDEKRTLLIRPSSENAHRYVSSEIRELLITTKQFFPKSNDELIF